VNISARTTIIVPLCLALSGCYVSTYGVQSTGGGTTSTTISSQVAATAKFSGGRASFSSGQPVSPAAPGGHVSLGRSGAAILVVGLVFAEAVNYVGTLFGAAPQPAPRTDAIAHTCSCYKQDGDEMQVTR
jgi:hypothetical protein